MGAGKILSGLMLTGSISLTGCSSFAPMGSGGFAEHHYQDLRPVEAGQPLTPAHGLRFDFELSRHLLKLLVEEGAERCFPATVAQARLREARIGRELLGGLEYDAANDILIQRDQLSRLERQMLAAQAQHTCQRYAGDFAADGTDAASMATQLDELLNADNQFAFGSSELNPKYMGRLAQAALLLRPVAHYQLQVIGHADAIGSEADNQQLSLKRAEQVSRYLQIFGVPASRIQVSAVGESEPLASGMAPENRLVNRRVSIVLIEGKGRHSILTASQRSLR